MGITMLKNVKCTWPASYLFRDYTSWKEFKKQRSCYILPKAAQNQASSTAIYSPQIIKWAKWKGSKAIACMFSVDHIKSFQLQNDKISLTYSIPTKFKEKLE